MRELFQNYYFREFDQQFADPEYTSQQQQRIAKATEKLPAKEKVIVIGESQAQGFFLAPHYCLAKIIQKRHPDMQVIDWSLVNLNQAQLIDLLKRAKKLNPKRVYLMWGNNLNSLLSENIALRFLSEQEKKDLAHVEDLFLNRSIEHCLQFFSANKVKVIFPLKSEPYFQQMPKEYSQPYHLAWKTPGASPLWMAKLKEACHRKRIEYFDFTEMNLNADNFLDYCHLSRTGWKQIEARLLGTPLPKKKIKETPESLFLAGLHNLGHGNADFAEAQFQEMNHQTTRYSHYFEKMAQVRYLESALPKSLRNKDSYKNSFGQMNESALGFPVPPCIRSMKSLSRFLEPLFPNKRSSHTWGRRTKFGFPSLGKEMIFLGRPSLDKIRLERDPLVTKLAGHILFQTKSGFKKVSFHINPKQSVVGVSVPEQTRLYSILFDSLHYQRNKCRKKTAEDLLRHEFPSFPIAWISQKENA